MTNKRSARPYIELGSAFPASHFRTVDGFDPAEMIRRETPVSLTLKKKFMRRLSFPTPWDGRLFAYARWNPGYEALCAQCGAAPRDIRKMYLVDWDDRFMLIMETKRAEEEYSFSVQPDEVLMLLENCMRIPAQRA